MGAENFLSQPLQMIGGMARGDLANVIANEVCRVNVGSLHFFPSHHHSSASEAPSLINMAKKKSKAAPRRPPTDEEPESEEEPRGKHAAKPKGHGTAIDSDGAFPSGRRQLRPLTLGHCRGWCF